MLLCRHWWFLWQTCKNSVIFANFGRFGMFRVKKNGVSVVRKSSKTPIFSVPPLWFTAKMTVNFAWDHQGARCYGTKKDELWDQNLTCAHFREISYFWEGFCLEVVILEKVPNFATLEELVFGKPSGSTSKPCNRLFAALCPKREIKGLFLEIWWEICLKLWCFAPKSLNKGIFYTNQAQKSIKVAWFPD